LIEMLRRNCLPIFNSADESSGRSRFRPDASVGNRAPAVLRRREQRRFFSASDDEVGGPMRAMREQLQISK
jgi:hypothetical protein